ncbi:MAG: metallophosphoesterase family protein [Chloroflexia bacterium]|nr:metallophosphoesterase family protein [Chloroflexia bacterium]
MKILCVSDAVDRRLYSLQARPRLADVDLVLAAGDLPASYLEFLVDLLEAPLYFVMGNHGEELVRDDRGRLRPPLGCTSLEGRVLHRQGLLLAGLGGSRRYRPGPYQYGEGAMARRLARLLPRLLYNRLRHGRCLDLLLTHSPPWGIHDRPDPAHQGFRCFLWAIERLRPRYLVHGHCHRYDRRESARTRHGQTWVVNAYEQQIIDLA